ncbi:MAG: flavin reductase [Proteobacteria bacterium]|nr:flavin reductase [Pseudomonadota bacterium]
MNLKAIQKICYGMYIVGSKKEGKLNGQIANTAFQITSEPPTIAISINKLNLTHECIMESKIFAISILSNEAPMTLIGNFGFKSGRDIDKFKDVKFKTGLTGAPIVLEYSAGYLECEVIGVTDVGTHSIFIGKVVDCDTLSDGEPMTYAYYHQIKGGKSPKTAPTYVKEEEPGEKPAIAGKYKCNVCGYVYDPANGDTDAGIKPGTAFEKLPENWVCPVCGASKSEFEPET